MISAKKPETASPICFPTQSARRLMAVSSVALMDSRENKFSSWNPLFIFRNLRFFMVYKVILIGGSFDD